MIPQLQTVPLEKAYRLLNHGPTVLVSASHQGRSDVMAAAWAGVLDFMPPKLTLVLDKSTYTRELVEASGRLAIQIPCAAQLELVQHLGTQSLHTAVDKLLHPALELFYHGDDLPYVVGCNAWLRCRVLHEPNNQDAYDLFILEVEAAWADPAVFAHGRWHFEQAPAERRSLHHVAGGHYYAIGEALNAST